MAGSRRQPITWPRLLLFDLDDTLCDYAGARDVRLRLAFAPALRLLPSLDPERLIADSVAMQPHGAEHFGELLRRHGLDDADVARAAMEWYRSNRFHGLRLFPDAATTLSALRRVRPASRIGLVTNGPAEVQRAKIDLLGVGALVDFAIVSGEVGVAKPDPAIFAEALRLGAAHPRETVFVGDSAEHDVAGARAAGIRAVWVNRTGGPWSHDAPPPDHEIDRLAALLDLLRRG